MAQHAKHLSTTAKIPHPYEFVHDEVGFNYRMPNLNAAVACAQLEQLENILSNKRELAMMYKNYFDDTAIHFVSELNDCEANYWLNTIVLNSSHERDAFLKETNNSKVMTRPIWKLMNKLPMYNQCQSGPLENAQWLEDRVVNIPSSYRP